MAEEESGPKIWGVCPVETGKAEVEDSPVNWVYVAIFMLCYLALTLHLAYSLYKFAVSKQWTNVMSSNKPQVILALALGSLFRLPTVLETNCVLEEVFRLLKDIFIMLSFLLIVMLWVEMQTSMGRVSSVERLRPYVIAVMVVYTATRTMQAVADLVLSRNIWLGFSFFTALVYAGVLGIGVYFGCGLLRKMGSMSLSSALKAKLQRMTSFIVYEIGLLFLIFLAWLVRTQGFGDAKEDDPWLWWGLKLIEKALEFIALVFLVQIVAPIPLPAACTSGAAPEEAAPKAGASKGDVETGGGGGSRGGGGGRGGGGRGGGGRGGGGRGGGGRGGKKAADSKKSPAVEMSATRTAGSGGAGGSSTGSPGSGGSGGTEDTATANPLNVASTAVDNPMHS